jgi:hypothetical protein
MTDDPGRGGKAPYGTFTRARMPWQRTLENGTILLLDDEGQALLALTPAAAEDLAESLVRQAAYIRAGAVPCKSDRSPSQAPR